MDRPLTRFRPFLLAAVTFIVALLAFANWSARSEAAVYCAVVLLSTPDCDAVSTNLQTALNQAAANPGHDEVRIFIGTFTGNFTYDDTSAGNTVQIRGKGTSAEGTTIAMADTNGVKTGLHVNAPEGSTVENLRVTIPTNADGNGDRGITLGDEVTADEVVVDGPTASNATGIWSFGATITDSLVDLSPSGDSSNFAIRGSTGDTHVSDSTLAAYHGFEQSDPGGTGFLTRSRVKARVGVTTDGGSLDLRNSLILLEDANGAVGIRLHNPNPGSSAMNGYFDGLTIVNGADNPGGDTSTGIRAIADNNPEEVTVNLTNSVISGFSDFPNGRTVDVRVNFGGVVKFDASYSAFDYSSSLIEYDQGENLQYTLGDGHTNLENGPGYSDPVNGDFTPAPGSELIDAGDPAELAPGAIDYLGNPRACHGKDDGVIRRDIGAIEHKTDPEDDCVAPVTSIIAGPQSPTTNRTPSFTFATTKNPGTYLCSWDGQPEAACAFNATAPDLGLGTHDLSVRTRDQYGNIDQTPETWSYEVIQKTLPSCETDPSLCPVIDKTAPKVTGLKAPKKTKLKRVKVRFKSNEAGVTFTCRLNKGKAKKCRSPWKTPKLKKGKNTITVQATDKAGNRSKPVKLAIRKTTSGKAKRR